MGSISPTCLQVIFTCVDTKSVKWLMTWLHFLRFWDLRTQNVGEMDTHILYGNSSLMPLDWKDFKMQQQCFDQKILLLRHSFYRTIFSRHWQVVRYNSNKTEMLKVKSEKVKHWEQYDKNTKNLCKVIYDKKYWRDYFYLKKATST